MARRFFKIGLEEGGSNECEGCIFYEICNATEKEQDFFHCNQFDFTTATVVEVTEEENE